MIVFERTSIIYVLNLRAVCDFWKWNPLTSVHIHKFPLAVVPNINNSISICACPGLTLTRWHLNITRIIIKRHQLAQGEASVVPTPATSIMAKKIGEIKLLLDPWVLVMLLLVESRMALNEPAMLAEVMTSHRSMSASTASSFRSGQE